MNYDGLDFYDDDDHHPFGLKVLNHLRATEAGVRSVTEKIRDSTKIACSCVQSQQAAICHYAHMFPVIYLTAIKTVVSNTNGNYGKF
jgi:hypothetical protein